MANFSGKVYYKLCEDYICNKCTLDDVNYAKKCLTEDISNIINLLENLQIQTNFHSLPNLEGNIPTRNIECNNMALLYLFTKSLEPPKDYNILNTGLGGIFIGPFFHCIYGNNWTNMLKSKYAKELNLSNINSFNDLIVDKDTFKNKNVLFLDDNVGTGTTMTEIRNEFINLGYNFKCGAVQYNWINYYKVEIGEKDIERFDPESIDYVTQINYPGHKLLEHAIEIIGGKRDINGNDISNKLLEKGQAGSNYIDYKASKHYYDEDIKSLQEKSIKYAKNANFEIYSKPLDELKFNSVLTEDSKKLMRNIYELTNKLFNAEKYIKYENN